MITFVLIGLIAGLASGGAALFLGHAVWMALALYSGCGALSLGIVIVRAMICGEVHKQRQITGNAGQSA